MVEERTEKGVGYLLVAFGLITGILGAILLPAIILVAIALACIGFYYIFTGNNGKSKKAFRLINEHIKIEEPKLIISEKGRYGPEYHRKPRLEVKISNNYKKDIIIDKFRWDILINDENIEDNVKFKKRSITIPNQSHYQYKFIKFKNLKSDMLHPNTKAILRCFIVFKNFETEPIEIPIDYIAYGDKSTKDFWRF